MRLDDLRKGHAIPRAITMEGEALTALAQRFDLIRVETLSADLKLLRAGRDEVRITGTLRARVVQPCVVTLEEVTSDLEVPVNLRLVPAEHAGDLDAPVDADVLLDDNEPDIEPYEDGRFDLEDLMAQLLGVSVPDYPRARQAAFEDTEFAGDGARPSHEADRDGGGKQNPFAVLESLKKDPQD